MKFKKKFSNQMTKFKHKYKIRLPNKKMNQIINKTKHHSKYKVQMIKYYSKSMIKKMNAIKIMKF